MSPEKEAYPPDQLGRATLSKKLAFIASEGRKAAAENPHYGHGCGCERCEANPLLDPSLEPEKTFFKLGPKNKPYGDVANACEAGRTAVAMYEAVYGGHFEWHSKVYEGDAGRSKKSLGRNYRGWLLIRFIPNGAPK